MNQEFDDHEEGIVYAERPNKTAEKRETEDNKALIKHMMNMGMKHFEALDMPEKLRDAILDCRRFTRVAQKRQIGFTAGIMRHDDVDVKAIQQQIDALERPSREEVAKMHRLEHWRDGLLANNNAVMQTIIEAHAQADRQYLRQLVRNAAKEKQQNKPPKSARALFQYLKDLED